MISKKKKVVPLAGIGTSNGGLETLKSLLQATPVPNGMALVLILQMDLNRENLLPSILSQHTSLRILEITENLRVEPDTVYVIPAGKYISVRNSIFSIHDPLKQSRLNRPIDYFFQSLAADREDQAIGVLLSGTDSDGVVGLHSIKKNGGIVIVQQPDGVNPKDQPPNIVARNLYDYSLPIEKIPSTLISLVSSFVNFEQSGGFRLTEEAETLFNTIIEVISTQSGHALHCYKRNTLMRRIQRRMAINHMKTFAEYLQYIQENHNESKSLVQDLLIGVTSFFREPDAWKTLEEQVISKLVQDWCPDDPIRVWVPGCSTGEEAYSIAICLQDQIELHKKNCKVQIFATDIDKDALEFARTGAYPPAVAADIAPERLQRYFIEDIHSYRVSKELRESVIFSPQNLISDPPFSKLSLIICRNVLIYLEMDIQHRVITLFHFALDTGGYLFLGSSEAIGKEDDLFEPISKKWRIYRRRGETRRGILNLPYLFHHSRRHPADLHPRRLPIPETRFAEVAQRELMNKFVPASVLIDRKYNIHYFHGPHENYLVQPTGEPTNDLLSLAREGLRTRLRGVIQRAINKQEEVVSRNAHVIRDGVSFPVTITVTPVSSVRWMEGLLLISFQESQSSTLELPSEELSISEESIIHQLEEELKTTKEELQSTIEELESSNDELKGSNEEIMSMNEEFQSTNEELETSKEELQSLNEELSTLNTQLQDKIVELESSNNDIINLLTSTNIATIFLDTNFCIRRYTSTISHILNLIPSDVGRPISDITYKARDPELLSEAKKVLDRLTSIEREIQNDQGSWFIRRIQPYRTVDNRIEGVVITYTDVLELKKAQEALRINEERFRIALQGSPIVVFNQDQDLRYTWIYNPKHGYTDDSVLLKTDKDLFDFTSAHVLNELKRRVLNTGKGERTEVIVARDGKSTVFDLTVEPLRNLSGEIIGITGAAMDITERKQVEESLRISEARFRMMADAAPVMIWIADVDKNCTYFNKGWLDFTGKTLDQEYGDGWCENLHADDLERCKQIYNSSFEQRIPFKLEYRLRRQDGVYRWVLDHGIPLFSADGRFVGYIGSCIDITDRKSAEDALREREYLLTTILNHLPIGVWYTNAEGKIILGNPAGQEIWGGARNLGQEDYREYKAWRRNTGKRIESHEWALARTLSKGEIVINEEIDIETFDGNRKIIRNSSVPIQKPEGIIGAVVLNEDITERKKAEDELIHTHRFLQTLIHSCPLAIMVLDPEGKVELWNPAAEQIYGWTEQEVVGQFLPAVPPDLVDEYHNHLKKVFEGQKIRAFETIRINKQGERLHISLWAAPIMNGDRKKSRIMSIVADITDRKRVEDALRISEERFRTALKGVPVTVFNQDRDLRYTWIHNPTIDLDEQQHLGKTDYDIFPRKEDAEWLESLKRHVLNTSEGLHEEVKLFFSGEFHYLHLNIEPLKNYKTNEVVGITCATIDVTDIHKQNEALAESESRFRSTFDNVAVGISHIDLEGRFLRVNQKICDITGYSHKELLQMTFHEITHPDDIENNIQNFNILIQGEIQSFSVEKRYIHKNGDEIWVQLTSSIQLDESGQPEYVISVTQDISARKKAEEQLRELNENLEKHVEERTQSLLRYQERLRDLATELTRTEQRERRRLASELHDYLAQMLVVCRLNINRLGKSMHSGRDMDIIQDMDRLLDESLRYTRTLIAELSPTILYEAGLISAVKWIAKQMERHDLHIEVTADSEGYPLPDDHAILVFQAVRELLHNVMKHAQTESAQIQMRRSEQNQLVITIEDQGVGFDPSSREVSVDTPKYGLFNIHERLEAAGGEFRIESTPGSGTKAKIVIPLKNLLTNSRQPIHTTQADSSGLPKKSKAELIRVLLVDDHDMVREGLRKVIDSFPGMQVIAEGVNGEEAVEMAHTYKPDVIVMDFNMPKMNGIEATRIIKQQLPSIEIIGLSVHDDRDLSYAMKEAGAHSYLIKGENSDLLYHAILAAVQR